MSLVNEVLKDLDRRQRQEIRAVHRVNNAMNTSLESNSKIGVLLGGGLVLGILAGLAGAYFYFDVLRQPEVPSDATQPVAQISPPPVQAVAAQPAAGTQVAAQAPAPMAPPVGNQNQQLPSPPMPQVSSINSNTSSSSFTLVLGLSGDVSHEITSRTERTLNILLPETSISNASSMMARNIEGLRIYEVERGLNLNLESGRRSGFEVTTEDSEGQRTLIITANFLDQPVENQAVAASPEPVPEVVPAIPPSPPVASSEADNAAPQAARTSRGLTLAERDRSASQDALRLVQGGQVLEAYGRLVEFITANPEAHQSRETLGTLLLAQGEFLQAQAILQEGLLLAPNNMGYKKLQARLFLVDQRPQDAIVLLERMPPRLDDDVEYFELLASLHQRIGGHDRAIGIYQDLLRADPRQSRWWTGLGISHEALGNREMAAASYQTALQGGNLDPELRRYSQTRLQSLNLQ